LTFKYDSYLKWNWQQVSLFPSPPPPPFLQQLQNQHIFIEPSWSATHHQKKTLKISDCTTPKTFEGQIPVVLVTKKKAD
jgi:hypothetical protein